MAPQNIFHLAELLNRDLRLPLRSAHDIARHLHPLMPRLKKRIVILVRIYRSVAPKINRVRIQRPSPAEKIRIKHLRRQRFPSAGRAARQHSRVRLRNHPEMRFEIRNHLLHQRVAVRPVIHRVHRIRIVVIRRRMLKRHGDHSRKIIRSPSLKKLVSRFDVQIRQPRPHLRVHRRILLRKSQRRPQTKMVFLINHRIVRVRMFLVTFRQKHNRPDIHRVSPKLCQHLALNLDVLHPRRIRRYLHRQEFPSSNLA